MNRVITLYRWFQIDDDGNLTPPEQRFDIDSCEWLTLIKLYNSEIDAHNALQEFVGENNYMSEEYVLIKTYKLVSKHY